MRVDNVAPRTWLLAAVAGWALLAWVLALAGMGGHAALLDDDASLLQALPQPRPSPPGRLGPLDQYGEIATRPLFADDRRPHPFSLQADKEEDQDNGFDYMLTGVLITPQLHMAIVQPTQGGDSVRVKLDTAADEIPAWRLVQLDARSAVFAGPDGQKTLELRVYDGRGGAAPTQLHDSTPMDNASMDGTPIRDANTGSRPSDIKPVEPSQPAAKPMSQAAPISEDRADADAGTTDAPDETSQGSQPQLDAIRERIEARRAQIRQAAEKNTAPAKKP